MVEITGRTRLAAVIGDPVRHSLSPTIHNAAFRHLGLDWVYVALPVATGDGKAAVEAMRTLGIDGLNVTMPHKADVATAVDDLSPAARALGVCNCLHRIEDPDGASRIVGHSTDGDGFVQAFRTRFGRSPEGLAFLVSGAGGAARSIVEALGRAGAASIAVANRTESRAADVAALAPQAATAAIDDAGAVAAADVVINTTAVGMAGGPAPDGIPVPVEAIRAEHLVVDIVYQPRITPLLAAAAERGARTDDGVAMLIGQAALAFQIWTGCGAPLEVMTEAVTAIKT